MMARASSLLGFVVVLLMTSVAAARPTIAVLEYRANAKVRPGHEWDRFEGLSIGPAKLEAFLREVPFNARGTRRLRRYPVCLGR